MCFLYNPSLLRIYILRPYNIKSIHPINSFGIVCVWISFVLSVGILRGASLSLVTPARKVAAALQSFTADVVLLQECGNYMTGVYKAFRGAGWYVCVPTHLRDPRAAKNYNVVLSRFPVSGFSEVQFSSSLDELCTRVDLEVSPGLLVRVYVCHFPIYRGGPRSRLRQFRNICEDASAHQGPVVIAGDCNTGVPQPGLQRSLVCLWHQVAASELEMPDGRTLVEDERLPFAQLAREYGFYDAFDLSLPTWSPLKSRHAELFQLKLDWLLVKGLDVRFAHMHPYVSDHRALEVVLIK